MKVNTTTSGRLALLVSAAAMVPSMALAQWNSSYTLCAPQYTGVPFTYRPPAADPAAACTQAAPCFYSNVPNAPNFQGNTDLDTGWTGAFRYVSSAGTVSSMPPYNVNPATTPDAAFQINQDSAGHFIYMSFQVNNDPSFDTEDAIVLGFDPDNKVNGDGITHPDMWRFIIYPLVGGGNGATDAHGKLPAGGIAYWKGWVKGTGWPNGRNTDPPFVTAVAHSTGVSPTLSWDVQIRIDTTALGLPAAPTPFGIYVNMVRVNSTTSPNTDTEFMWPNETPLGLLIPGSEAVMEANSLPDPSQWGTGSLATSCTGVNISYSDITGSHGSTISLNQPNQFSVLIHNSGVRQANQVFATFQIANYGLPAPDDWARPGEVFNNLITNDPLPSDASPPTVNIGGGGGTATMSTGLWTPGPNHAVDGSTPLTEHDYYQATPDTCIRVILSSLATDTIFSVRSSWNNFETGNTSTFKHTATVGTKGYRRADNAAAANEEFLLTVAHDYTPACEDRALFGKYPDLGYSVYRKVVHGCRVTGRRLVIKEKKFDECEDVGTFGYNLRHQGRVQNFTDDLTGEGLQKTKTGYHLVVAAGKKAALTTTVVSHGGHEGGGEGGPGNGKPPCGEGNKKQGGAGAVGILLIGLLTFTHSRKRQG